ncbi:hypothetical protein P3S67_018148 [Capsicum chacoense]
MGNLFCTEYAIHRCFDLKGSSRVHLTEKAESQIDYYYYPQGHGSQFLYSDCRKFGSKSSAGKWTETVISMNRRESWTTIFWLECTSEKFQVPENQHA